MVTMGIGDFPESYHGGIPQRGGWEKLNRPPPQGIPSTGAVRLSPRARRVLSSVMM